MLKVWEINGFNQTGGDEEDISTQKYNSYGNIGQKGLKNQRYN